MARDPDTIQREIERTRDELADSLDALTERAHPKRLVDGGKRRLQERLADPNVRYALMAVGGLLALAVLRKLFR
ncbi:MAG TPA: DUF3618 domain-containing protein [Pseudonocardia sp.]|nr:DUF3618 domain-containing protein [Pseudonocardia sp.]